MKDKITDRLNKLEWFITEKSDINIGDYQEIIKETQAIRELVLTIPVVGSSLPVETKILLDIEKLLGSNLSMEYSGNVDFYVEVYKMAFKKGNEGNTNG